MNHFIFMLVFYPSENYICVLKLFNDENNHDHGFSIRSIVF